MFLAKSSNEAILLEDRKYQLEELQKFVGGMIEFVFPRKTPTHVFICNEDGLSLGLPPNEVGSLLYGDSSPVVGDVVVMTRLEYNKFFRERDDG